MPNLSVAQPKCFHCGSTTHKSFNCGLRQQQQQFRNPGPPQPIQNQNWGPSNHNYANLQPNQSNFARGSGQSGNAGYSHGGYNNTGYNNTRNAGYSNNNYSQQGYGNQQRGQSNFSPRDQQTNRPSNMGNRQPQYQQGPQTSYGVRTLQINSDGWNEGCADDENFDNPEREFC
ncbi:MAG: hypothetical protein GY821_17100, partial [Gammaproteobacteria bacterium]|nr:hypothetical protein [Gammaproteobacteria bacterium]